MRRNVLGALLSEVFHLIAGDRWAKAERAAREPSGGGDILRIAEGVLARKRDELTLLAKLAAEANRVAIRKACLFGPHHRILSTPKATPAK